MPSWFTTPSLITANKPSLFFRMIDMKTLLALLLLLPMLQASAQLSTNVIEIRVRFASGTPTTTLTLDPVASKKDKARLEALVWQHARTGGTNEFTQWAAKTWVKDQLDVLAAAKQEEDAYLKNLRESVNTVLKQNPEDVTTNEFTTLEAIAAKKQ